MMTTTLHVPSHSSATTVSGSDFDEAYKGFLPVANQPGQGRLKLQIMREFSSWAAAGVMIGSVQIITLPHYGVTGTHMSPSGAWLPSVDRSSREPAAFGRLDELSYLEEDWDSYGATPPTPTAIESAKGLLTRVASRNDVVPGHGVGPDAVMPFPNGGVQLIWERNSSELQVDVGPTGDFGYLWIKREDGRREAVEAEVAPGDEILTLVDQFLS